MKIVIYGLGNNYKIMTQNSRCFDDMEIVALSDIDPAKIGMSEYGKDVIMPEMIPKVDFDRLVVTIEKYDDAILKLREYVADDQIDVYCAKENKLIPFVELKNDWIDRVLSKRRIVRQIQESMLREAYQLGEFNDDTAIVVSGDEYVDVVSSFLQLINSRIRIECLNEIKNDVTNEKKYILCDYRYTETISFLREHGINDKKWIILPLYDVENNVVL